VLDAKACGAVGLRAILLGPPGAGKGTQAAAIVERFGVPHISSGDLFRRHVAERTELGVRLEPYLSAGELVPDDLLFVMLAGPVADAGDSSGGYLLDGFPRSITQAEQAYEIARQYDLLVHAVIALEAPHDVLVERLVLRGETSGRLDDTESVVRHRLDVYDAMTHPLLDYYDERGVLHRVDASGSIDEVRDVVLGELESAVAAVD
jgi:adenylate kinase